MPIFIRKNGLWKEIEQPYSRVEGKIKETDVYTRVDGKPRLVFGKVTAADILGFRMVYYPKKDAEYIDIPTLKFNLDLPVLMHETDRADVMDIGHKGVVYEFFDTHVEQDGILMYEGRLLAVLKNGMLLDIFGNPEPIPGLDAPLVTKSMDFTVMVSYDVRYQGYGTHTRGWNSMWSSVQFLKPDTEDATYFKEDIRLSENHVLVPTAESNACRELRAMGLKDLSYERALQMLKEVLDLPSNTDRSTYAAKAYPDRELQCPGRTNDVISFERASELWSVVYSNKDGSYSEGLFNNICKTVGVNTEEETTCSIYGKCKLGYLTYRAAMGIPDCPEYEALQWPSMSYQHAVDVWNMADNNRSQPHPEYVADEVFDPEERQCPGRDVPPIGYTMSLAIFDAVWKRRNETFRDYTVNQIMDELGIYEAASDYCTLYEQCRYDEISYSQAIYFKSCGIADIDDEMGSIIPDDTSSICEIGIARSMHIKDHHMQGSRGVLSHNIYSISLDGTIMPFTVQIVR